MKTTLAQCLFDFAQATHDLPEYILNNDGWAAGAYEGIRYAFLQSYLELRELAARLLAERAIRGQPPTESQRILAQHRAAFRDFQALLLGVEETWLDTPPALGEWPIRTILTHVHETELYFFAHILNGLHPSTTDEMDAGKITAITGHPWPTESGTLPELWERYAQLHSHIADHLASLDGAQLATLSAMWEPQPLPIRFRMHRFDAHLREHANQLDKTLHALDHAPNEAKLLLRQVYDALAEVEGALIGTQQFGDFELCEELAESIAKRSNEVLAAVPQIQRMIEAIKAGDAAAVQASVQTNPALAYAVMEDGLSGLMYAHYRGQGEVVAALRSGGRRMYMTEAAALGDLERVQRIANAWKESINHYSNDGYTPLQLACFFGHPAVAAFLLQNGADPGVVSKNVMRIQPIHAAVASRQAEIVQMLIEAGADVNAKQQDDFTPLMAALQNGDAKIAALLRQAGALD